MKTGIICLLITDIIRTCLGFYILMLALPKDSIQNMFILGQNEELRTRCYQWNFHRLESPDAEDLLSIGKRFQKDF